jgi:hypothetical protein
MLDLYIHLIIFLTIKLSLINNQRIGFLQREMDKIEKSKIPVEQGESELIKMMDPARAIPTQPLIDPNTPRVE